MANRPVRRSALISPWGVGSTVDFPNDESLMTCGLDAWPYAIQNCPPDWSVTEERLQKRLGVEHFRLPPDFRIPGKGVQFAGVSVPFVRFPRWHYCPMCGYMSELGLGSQPQQCAGPAYPDGVSCHNRTRKPHLIPVRFVVVCTGQAHIRDFPFLEWAHHEQKPVLSSCRLRLRAGRSSAGLSGIKIECSCGASGSMANAFGDDALRKIGVHCGGQRPWLGDDTHDETRCGLDLKVLQRGASNVYFPQTMSSIYLPLWAENTKRPVIEVLEDPGVWGILCSGLVNGKIDPFRCEMVCGLKPHLALDKEELRNAAQRKLDGHAPQTDINGQTEEAEEEEYRRAEFNALREGRGNVDSELATDLHHATEYDSPVRDVFSRLTLVKKLRETRALYGFARYLPDAPRNYEDYRRNMRLNRSINWLPAVVTRGEGIFFEFDSQAIDQWLLTAGTPLLDRVKGLTTEFNKVRLQRQQQPRTIHARYIMLHTLAHLLINQLSYECGYGSSSLRERIFCDSSDPSRPMNAFLIYTASGDSEGTMGGLVRQGKPGRIEDTLLRALLRAQWCSYDPVCIESRGQGPDSCNLAACHGCTILPETSCETGNRLLDRVCVVGTPDNPGLGMFGLLLQSQLTEMTLQRSANS